MINRTTQFSITMSDSSDITFEGDVSGGAFFIKQDADRIYLSDWEAVSDLISVLRSIRDGDE